MTETVLLAASLFLSTNTDDVFVVVALLSSGKTRVGTVVAGQFIGITALFLGSVMLAQLQVIVPRRTIGLLGFIPVTLGVQRLYRIFRHTAGDDEAVAVPTGLLSVAAITLANGGDNVAVYTPVFATRPQDDLLIFAVIFAFLTSAIVAAAYVVLLLPRVGTWIRGTGQWLAPVVLIVIGLMVFKDTGLAEEVLQIIHKQK